MEVSANLPGHHTPGASVSETQGSQLQRCIHTQAVEGETKMGRVMKTHIYRNQWNFQGPPILGPLSHTIPIPLP